MNILFPGTDLIEIFLANLKDGDGIKSTEEVCDWINGDAHHALCAYLIGDLYYLQEHFSEKITHGFDLYL